MLPGLAHALRSILENRKKQSGATGTSAQDSSATRQAPAACQLTALWGGGEWSILAGRNWVAITSDATLRLRHGDFDTFSALIAKVRDELKAGGALGGTVRGLELRVVRSKIIYGNKYRLEISGQKSLMVSGEVLDDIGDWLSGAPQPEAQRAAQWLMGELPTGSDTERLTLQLEEALAGKPSGQLHWGCPVRVSPLPHEIVLTVGNGAQENFSRCRLAETIRVLRSGGWRDAESD